MNSTDMSDQQCFGTRRAGEDLEEPSEEYRPNKWTQTPQCPSSRAIRNTDPPQTVCAEQKDGRPGERNDPTGEPENAGQKAQKDGC